MYVIKCHGSCLLKKCDPCCKCMLSLLLVVSNVVMGVVWSGVIYVVDELDYEQKQQYELTIRATDGVFPVYAEVLVSILVQDVNDCPPEFTQDAYNISVSEAAPFGTSVLRVVSRDNDTGIIFNTLYNIRHMVLQQGCCLLGCCALMLDKYFLTFQRVIVPLSFGSRSSCLTDYVIAFLKAVLLSL